MFLSLKIYFLLHCQINGAYLDRGHLIFGTDTRGVCAPRDQAAFVPPVFLLTCFTPPGTPRFESSAASLQITDEGEVSQRVSQNWKTLILNREKQLH